MNSTPADKAKTKAEKTNIKLISLLFYIEP